ncbi:reverse transcriptase [Senna tora]|uniref:Reverse transcriptase n=1 Tax=Senna tora TaxID=362788 RepID=A0A834TP55_9FABA|nr:reverse transcriptase [Senna tora]
MHGDINSKFFHASVIHRRQRNKILRIKQHDDLWISDEEGIANCFFQFYLDLFRHGGRRDFSKVLGYVIPVITRDENEAVLKEITLLEVKEATFQLDGLKALGLDGFSAHEVFHYLRSKKKGSMFEYALKMDMNKASDRIEWDFLREVLLKLDFHMRWVQIIMGCVSSVNFSLLLSGRNVAEFTLGRGLRQGDLLSPYLFIIIADVFSLMISCYIANGDLRGVKLARYGPTLSHCFFADNALLFMNSDLEDCLVLKSLISYYCEASGQEGSKLHWKAWHKLVVPKKDGGLGFKDFQKFKIALLAKQAWRILENPDDLWVQVLKGSYFSNGDFLNAKKGYRASWAWSSILEGRNLLMNGACSKIGNGEYVFIWKDKWVKELIVDGALDLSVIEDVINPVEAKAINSIAIRSNGSADRLIWPLCKDGSLWKAIWGVNAVPKVKSFLWMACVRALLTCEALYRRKCAPSPACHICGLEEETDEHVILLCD